MQESKRDELDSATAANQHAGSYQPQRQLKIITLGRTNGVFQWTPALHPVQQWFLALKSHQGQNRIDRFPNKDHPELQLDLAARSCYAVKQPAQRFDPRKLQCGVDRGHALTSAGRHLERVAGQCGWHCQWGWGHAAFTLFDAEPEQKRYQRDPLATIA